jgi:hypothetical protein
MRKLQSLLGERETAVTKVDFDHLNHRIRCYAHIINICSSHIIASVTSTSKSYLSDLEAPVHLDYVACGGPSDDESDDEQGDDDYDPGHDIGNIEPAGCFDARGDAELARWFAGFKRDPLRCAQRLVQFLHSSDQCREGLCKFIEDGNSRGWFTGKDGDGSRITLRIPQLQLLRDVKTQWDSVYMMLEHLRQLRPVGSSQ